MLRMALGSEPWTRLKRQPLVNARFVEFLTKSWSYLFLLGLVVFFSLTGTGFFLSSQFLLNPDHQHTNHADVDWANLRGHHRRH